MKSDSASKGARSLALLALVLGVAGLVLGGSAIGVAVTHSGANGAAGSRGAPGVNGTNGARGPAGPGAIVKQVFNDGTTVMTGTCGFYNGSNLSFTVAGPGTFVVTASLVLYIHHSLANYTFYTMSLANASAACNPSANNYVEGEWSDALPNGTYYPDFDLVQSFQVGAAGTYTFGIIGTMGGGTDPTEFYYASTVGVFYPS
jgi:hypothetical protein